MYNTAQTVLWFDMNRVSRQEAIKLKQAYRGHVVPVDGSDPPPIGIIGEPYPTPDQLWRWTPQEKR